MSTLTPEHPVGAEVKPRRGKPDVVLMTWFFPAGTPSSA